MNNVPNSDSETVLSPKTGQVHSVNSQLTQLASPGAPRSARIARTGTVSWPRPRPYHGLGRPCRGLVPQPCRRPGGRVVAKCRAQARPCRGLPRDTALPQAPLPVTIHPSVLRHTSQPSQPSCHDTLTCIATHFPHQPSCLSHDTKFVS